MNCSNLKIIQSFEFPEACIAMKMTEDKTHIITCGSYKPQLRIYDLNELNLKVERHMESEGKKIEILEEDYGKIAILRNDRYIEFHAKYGLHHLVRIPKLGNDLSFNKISAELLICGDSSDIYRFNLEQGRFLKSLISECDNINSIKTNPVHNLICGVGNKITFFDPRSRNCLKNFVSENVEEYSSISFNNNGINFCVGTEDGNIIVYDLRSKKELFIKKHQNENKIKEILYSDKNIYSLDQKTLNVWNLNQDLVKIETGFVQNTFIVDDGFVSIGGDTPEIHCYYSSILGKSPTWCTQMDTLDLNSKNINLDNFVIITKKEMQDYNLQSYLEKGKIFQHLNRYMIDSNLYNSLTNKNTKIETRKTKEIKKNYKLIK
ncbi:hypothetical protein CWI38_1687p0030 [Hamiltosporidium tvaerminnensis]|uniref:Nucleolar protein 10-like N-terminal domain-containing protein n=2 Tax=Hamiltosporidium TaxID=1176354 RepID=A0A4Q9L139_9MICR|nr:hypothetical protein CWI39_1604p0020 [Hamiltosporidium magnivora]TBU10548.1 hypothetical protein CWI38_1687p0030 [Hamiltosporidium tvaerminnensis]